MAVPAKHKAAPEAPELVSESTTIIQVIERAARDSNVDVDKMSKLLDMHERVMMRHASQQYEEAMNAAQEEMAPVSRDAANPQTRSRYASYEALDRALRPIYAKHGFSLSFDTSDGAPEAHVRVVCKVAHSAGHSERPHLDMPADGKGAKGGDVMTKTHATMAAVSYAKRGLLKMIFNIAEGDDDGNYGARGEAITIEQAETVRRLLNEIGGNAKLFCQYFRISAIPDLPKDKFDIAVAMIEKKRARQ